MKDMQAQLDKLRADAAECSHVAALFRVVNRYVGNPAPMPGVFPDYPAPLVRNTDAGAEMVLMRLAERQRSVKKL